MQTANPESASLKLLVLGFNETERRLLQSIVKLSQRRTPALHLLEADEGPAADKKQMQESVKMIFKLKAVPKPDDAADALAITLYHLTRSEERRVGKECRSRWSPYH